MPSLTLTTIFKMPLRESLNCSKSVLFVPPAERNLSSSSCRAQTLNAISADQVAPTCRENAPLLLQRRTQNGKSRRSPDGLRVPL